MIEKLDCRTCGVCCICFEDQEAYCDLTEEDEKQLSKTFVKKNVVHSCTISQLAYTLKGMKYPYGVIKTRWKRMKSGPLKGYEMNVCVALRGSVMSKTSCSIYKNRPQVCRVAVKPGTGGCREIRACLLRAIGRLE